MRSPKYLSPSSLGKWESSKEDFYLQYLADERPPRYPQTRPMSVGSAFDAWVKNYCHKMLFDTMDPEFELDTIFEQQVEPHNRDWARKAGEYTFDCYKTSGALADLLTELQASGGNPRFEFTLNSTICGVPLLGKPDLFYIHSGGTPIILDWKVNGFCARSPKSPDKGFMRIRDGWVGVPSRGANQMHRDAQPMKVNGVNINVASWLEDANKGWATQLATYAWLCGEEVGSEFVVALDQIVCKPDAPDRPLIRVAEHRSRISPAFQHNTMERYQDLWDTIQSGHIFSEVSLDESIQRCKTLDGQHKAFEEGGDFLKQMAGRG